MYERYLQNVQQPGQRVSPLLQLLGIAIVGVSKSEATLRLPLRPDFLQGAGVVGGGIVATLADEAMGHVVAANLGPDENAATVEMNTRFLKPLTTGEITAVATLIKKGRRMITMDCSVTNEAGERVATAGGSFLIFPRSPAQP